MEPWGRPSLNVRFMNQEVCHSVKKRGTPIFSIFTRSPVRLTRLYSQLKSKKVSMVHRRWVDWSPSGMNCDSRRHWSVVLRPLRKPACQGLRDECSSSYHDRWLVMSLSKTFSIVEVSAIGR